MIVIYTATGLAVAYLAVRAVTWRLTHHPGPCSPRWWLLAPTALLTAGVLWWLGHPDLASYLVAATAGAPFLLSRGGLWGRLLRVDLHIDCWQCELTRLGAGQW